MQAASRFCPAVPLKATVPAACAFLLGLPALAAPPADGPALPPLAQPAGLVPPGSDPRRFEDVFRPYVTDHATLSPDGRHLAYTVLDGTQLKVAVVAIDAPERVRTSVVVNTLKAAQPDYFNGGGRITSEIPPSLSWLAWTSPTRLVALARLGQGPALMAFDADGANAKVLATNRTTATFGGYSFFARSAAPDTVILRMVRRRPPGFWAPIPSKNYSGIDYEYQRLDTVTGEFTEIKEDAAFADRDAAVRAAQAARGDWQQAERDLRAIVPDRRVTLLENDTAENRYLALVEGLAEPGSYCVIDYAQRKCFDLIRRLPDLAPERTPRTTTFAFTAADGQQVSGEIALPPRPRTEHVPLVVFMPDKPGRKVDHAFSREVQAFADMGFASVRFDSLARPETQDEPPRVLERKLVAELIRLIDGLPGLHPVSKRRIILYGEDTAGYLALRALQIQPQRFTAAVVLEPNLSVQRWNAPENWPENAGKPGGPSGLRRPVFALVATSRNPARHAQTRELVRDAKKAGAPAAFREQPIDFQLKLPAARAAAFREIEGFINAIAYDYTVDIGDLKVLP